MILVQRALGILALCILLPTLATAAIFVDFNRNKKDVEFVAIGKPSFLKIRGNGAKTKGRLLINGNSVKGILKVPLKDFDTGIGLRDRHMKNKYLEVKKYPHALLKITQLQMKRNILKDATAQKKIPFKGKLKLHGVTRPVNGTFDVSRNGRRVLGEARFSVDITKYGVDIPKFKGVTMAKEVKISAKFDAPLVKVRK